MGKASWDFSINIYIFFPFLSTWKIKGGLKLGKKGSGLCRAGTGWDAALAMRGVGMKGAFPKGAFPGGSGCAWVGMGFLFFPKLLCPRDPMATSHPGQEQLPRSQKTAGADTDQDPARGERPGWDVSNCSGDFSQKISGSG